MEQQEEEGGGKGEKNLIIQCFSPFFVSRHLSFILEQFGGTP